MTDDGHTVTLSPREYHELLANLPLLFLDRPATELPVNLWGGPREVYIDRHSAAVNG